MKTFSHSNMHCQASIDISAAGRTATEGIGAGIGDYMNHALDIDDHSARGGRTG